MAATRLWRDVKVLSCAAFSSLLPPEYSVFSKNESQMVHGVGTKGARNHRMILSSLLDSKFSRVHNMSEVEAQKYNLFGTMALWVWVWSK